MPEKSTAQEKSCAKARPECPARSLQQAFLDPVIWFPAVVIRYLGWTEGRGTMNARADSRGPTGAGPRTRERTPAGISARALLTSYGETAGVRAGLGGT